MYQTQERLNRSDGVAVYVKTCIEPTVKEIKIGAVSSLELSWSTNKETIKITAIYRSPSTDTNEFIVGLERYLQNAANVDWHFLVGDINIDILAEDAAECQEYLNVVNQYGYCVMMNKPTRDRTCLDHVMLKCKGENTAQAVVHEVNITDHRPVSCFAHMAVNSDKVEPVKNFKKINYKEMFRLVKGLDWKLLYDASDPEDMANYLIENLVTCMKSSTTHVKTKRGKKEWITPGIINSMNRRDKLFRQTKKEPMNENLKQEHKKLRNEINVLIKISKRQYYESIIQRENTAKGMWTAVDRITNRKSRKVEIKKIVSTTNEEIVDKTEIAEVFNIHYTELGKIYADKIMPGTPSDVQQRNIATFYLHPTNSLEIEAEIRQLKDKKTPGGDGITSEVMKVIGTLVSGPLAFLINECFTQGVFPKVFKTSTVTPLYKTGDRTKIINYRPLSLTSTISKIMEKLIKSRIMKFLNKYKIVSDRQFGFKQDSSTTDAMALLAKSVYEGLDNGETTVCIFADLAKAFDTVHHDTLLSKLEAIGIRGMPLQLFGSYLQQRFQCVKIEDVYSSYLETTYGVPQGTVLGPVLFVIYVNDLFSLDIQGEFVAFADDTAILYRRKTVWNVLRSIIEKDLELINGWFCNNKLTLNAEKTRFIYFNAKTNIAQPLRLKIKSSCGEKMIYSTDVIKYLGVHLDENMRWNHHVESICKKLRSLLYKFKQLKLYLPVKTLMMIYYALVESHITYGIVVWGGLAKTILKPALVLQKRFLKIIYGRQTMYSTELLYKESEVLNPRKLYAKATLEFMYRRDKFETVDHSYWTRNIHSGSVYLPRMQKTIGQRSFIYWGPRLFNRLPLEIKNARSFAIFRRRIKLWILSNDLPQELNI